MDRLAKMLQKETVLLADGAWGTEFFKRGLMQGCPPDEWNLTHPEIVKEITGEYLDAGSRIILTNTFGANRFRMEPHGLSERVRDINLRRRRPGARRGGGARAHRGRHRPFGAVPRPRRGIGSRPVRRLLGAGPRPRRGRRRPDRRGVDDGRRGDGRRRERGSGGHRAPRRGQHDLQPAPPTATGR